MELSSHWTCSCGAQNVGDVFEHPCWMCGQGGNATPKIEIAAMVCPDCKSTDGFHKMNCPTHPLPPEWIKKP